MHGTIDLPNLSPTGTTGVPPNMMFALSRMFTTGNVMLDMMLVSAAIPILALLAKHMDYWWRLGLGHLKRFMEPPGYSTMIQHEWTRRGDVVTFNERRWVSKENGRLIIAVTCLVQELGWRASTSYQYVTNDASSDGPYAIIDSQTIPENDQWIEVNFKDALIRVMFSNESNEHEAGRSDLNSKVVESLRIHGPDRETVEAFIARAVEVYNERKKEEYESQQDRTRFCFITSSTSSKKLAYASVYKMANTKTFDTLFFDDKPRIMKKVDDFMNKRGIYAQPFKTHKLTMLLYGPPGTGKTSLIKAIAEHTGRHVISVRLSMIANNDQLKRLLLSAEFEFYNPRYSNIPTPTIENSIFVIEEFDVYLDSLADAFANRDGKEEEEKKEEEEEDEEVNVLPVDFDAGADAADMASQLKAIMQQGLKLQRQQQQPISIPGVILAKRKTRPEYDFGTDISDNDENKDKLDIASILDVMDGIVETPGRILILTTNKIDKVRNIDRAFLRPGRIDEQLEMGYISAKSLVEMVESIYKTELTDEQKDILGKITAKNKISAATIEAMMINAETIDSFFESLSSMM